MEKPLAYKVPAKFEYSNSDGSSWTEETVANNHTQLFNEGWQNGSYYWTNTQNRKKIRWTFTNYGYRFHACTALRMTTSSNTITIKVEKSSTNDFSSGVSTVFTSSGMNGWPGLWQILQHWHNSTQSLGLRITLESEQDNTNAVSVYNLSLIHI